METCDLFGIPPRPVTKENYLKCPSCWCLSVDGKRCESPLTRASDRESAIVKMRGHDCKGWRSVEEIEMFIKTGIPVSRGDDDVK